jgi:hypothetical protein
MESLYQKFLWFLGFKEGETISACLARQKERLGWTWWLMPIITILFTLAILAFEGWMLWHIITFKLPKVSIKIEKAKETK